MQYKLKIENENGDVKDISDYLNIKQLIFDDYKDAVLESIKISKKLFENDKSLKVHITNIK